MFEKSKPASRNTRKERRGISGFPSCFEHDSRANSILQDFEEESRKQCNDDAKEQCGPIVARSHSKQGYVDRSTFCSKYWSRNYRIGHEEEIMNSNKEYVKKYSEGSLKIDYT